MSFTAIFDKHKFASFFAASRIYRRSKRFSNSGLASHSDGFALDSDSVDHRFNLTNTTTAALASSDCRGDRNEGPTLARSRSRSHTSDRELSVRPSRGSKGPTPGASTTPPPKQRKRSRSPSQSHPRGVLPALKLLSRLRPLKPPPASASAADPPADRMNSPNIRVEAILEEKEEAFMDVDASNETNRRSPRPAGLGNAVVAIADSSVLVDSAANNADVNASSQPDWMHMTTQAPHDSLSDL